MAKTTFYKIELKHSSESGAKLTTWRAGRQFNVKIPQFLELTQEEVKAFKNDYRFTLTKTNRDSVEADKVETTSDSESDSLQGSPDVNPEVVTSEDTDSEDVTSVEAEEDTGTASDAPTVESLVKDNSRPELNALAVEVGIEAPEALESKTDVATAIVEAK